MLARAKPLGNRHDHARIPKLVLQDRDFSQIDIFMIKLRKGEVETIDGHIVMTAQDGETYRVIPALEGWTEYWKRLAEITGAEYDDEPLRMLMNRLNYGMHVTDEMINRAERVVDLQRSIFYRTPNAVISSQATTQQIKMMMEK